MNKRPLSELRDTGLLWLINRTIFHPRGYALALHLEDDGSISGWSILGDGTEVWTYAEAADDECFAKTVAFFAGLANGGEQIDRAARLLLIRSGRHAR